MAQICTQPTFADALQGTAVQGLANTLWAFAKLKQPAPRLCEAAAAEILRRLSDFSLRDLSQILWAFAKMGHKGSPKAVAAMANHTAAVMKAKGAHHCSSLLPSSRKASPLLTTQCTRRACQAFWQHHLQPDTLMRCLAAPHQMSQQAKRALLRPQISRNPRAT